MWRGKFPVVSLSLKDIDAGSYETAFAIAVMLVNEEAGRHLYLLESERLTQREKEAFSKLLRDDMEEAVLYGSLKLMSRLLEKHHGQKAVILIDEYDVPLARAHVQGYYDEMIIFIRSLFHQSLKTNSSGNDAVKRFLKEAGSSGTVKREIENLIAGELVTREIHQDLTYPDMYNSIDNIWSVLFTTGYLTQRGRGEGRSFSLAIPNLEVREIFTRQIMDMFKEDAKNDGDAFYDEDIEKVLKYGIACYKDKCKVMLAEEGVIVESPPEEAKKVNTGREDINQ